MGDRFSGYNEFSDAKLLPDHLRRLHRRAQAAARASHDARIPHTLAHRDENDRRWPGDMVRRHQLSRGRWR